MRSTDEPWLKMSKNTGIRTRVDLLMGIRETEKFPRTNSIKKSGMRIKRTGRHESADRELRAAML